MTDRDDELPSGLHDAVALLRESEEPSAEWRARVVRRATEAPAVIPLARRPGVWWAAAAAFAGMIVGGSAVYVAMRSPGTPAVSPVAQVAAPTSDVRVRFTYHAPGASNVTIVGDFNRWDPATIPLRRSADGSTWEIEIPLTPGRYAYAFYVDGKLARDPAAPQVRDDDFGSSNSVVMVRGS